MNSVKLALGDYINDNFNKSKQGSFLKASSSRLGFNIPLKDQQIKIEKNDVEAGSKVKPTNETIKVYVKQQQSSKKKAEQMMYYGQKKKETFKEFDLKSNKVIDVIMKKKRAYAGSSDSDN